MGFGGSKGGKITADNLYSQDILEIGAGIGQGTIYGLTDGLKSFYIGGIPFESETNEINFQDVCVSFRQGYFDDLPVRYVMGGEGSVMQETVGLTLPGEVPRTIITPTNHRGRIKQIDVRLLVSALYAGDSKGNNGVSSLIMSIKYRKVGTTQWRYVTETTASLYSQRAQLDTLRQEAALRGLDFDVMTAEDKNIFAKEVLTENTIISEAKDLKKNYIPAPNIGGFGLGGLQGMMVQSIRMNNWQNALLDQISQNAEIEQAVTDGHLRIEGKTTAGYVYEVSIPIYDNEGDTHDWEIQVTRLSKELTSDEKKYSNKIISIESISLITDKEKQYRKTAVCQIVAQHTDRFDSIPDFSGEFYGFICDIPSNYNPFEHTYDGVWDGSYKKGWTNNHFWILRELIMNYDWGLRAVEPRIEIDNAGFYELAKYCDERVLAFDGTMKPRYTFNEVVQEQVKIKDYLNYVAGSVHTTLREINGVYYAFMDRPREVGFFITPEMITQTGFQYSSADLESKYNSVRVTFLNEENNYQSDRRTVVDNESINRYGLIPYEFQAIGCTNVSEAIRQAVYTLLTNRDEDIFATFTSPRLGHLVNMYDNFYLAHKENGWGNHARILGFNPSDNSISLRDPIYVTDYDVLHHTPAGIARNKATAIDPYTLRLTGALSNVEYLSENTPIIISGGIYGEPKVFRVLGIMQDDSIGASKGEAFQFKSSIVSNTKYTALDNITDPELVELQYDVVDVTYERKTIPSAVKNVRLRYLDWASSNNQLAYQINFTAQKPAHHYDIVWIDDTTGEERNQRIFGLGGELFPAFTKETKKVSLRITPFDAKGNAGQTKYIRDIVPYTAADAQIPILRSTTQSGSNIIIAWSAETSNMFQYKSKFFSYVTPKETKTNIELKPGDTEYKVPNHGVGDYSFQLTYDKDGSGSKVSSEVWDYTAESTGSYELPYISHIFGSMRSPSGAQAPAGSVFVEMEVDASDWKNNTDLSQLVNPFSIRYETSPGSDSYAFLTGKYTSSKLTDTSARITTTVALPVGSHIQIRLQNQWGTTYSAWSEALIPQDPSYVPPTPAV